MRLWNCSSSLVGTPDCLTAVLDSKLATRTIIQGRNRVIEKYFTKRLIKKTEGLSWYMTEWLNIQNLSGYLSEWLNIQNLSGYLSECMVEYSESVWLPEGMAEFSESSCLVTWLSGWIFRIWLVTWGSGWIGYIQNLSGFLREWLSV